MFEVAFVNKKGMSGYFCNNYYYIDINTFYLLFYSHAIIHKYIVFTFKLVVHCSQCTTNLNVNCRGILTHSESLLRLNEIVAYINR